MQLPFTYKRQSCGKVRAIPAWQQGCQPVTFQGGSGRGGRGQIVARQSTSETSRRRSGRGGGLGLMRAIQMVPLASRRRSGSCCGGTRRGEGGGDKRGQGEELRQQKRGRERGGRRRPPATRQRGREKDLQRGPPVNADPEMKGEEGIRRGESTGGEGRVGKWVDTKQSAGGGSGGRGTK